MRYAVLILAMAVALAGFAACERQEARPDGQASRVGGEPEKQHPGADDRPHEEPLLLLEDAEEAPVAPSGPMADNSRCHVCHLNYVREELAVFHARADIGCADCHGDSDAHIADESWASGGNGTPPNVMYPREKINPSCAKCHPRDKINKALHEAFFAGKTTQKLCTDCHGKHRLARRTCRWK